MTAETETRPPDETPDLPPPERPGLSTQLLRIGVSLVVPVLAALGLYYAGIVLLDEDSNRAVVVLMALIVGVLGVFALYYGMDWVIGKMPDRFQDKVRPFAFVGPAIVILGVFLVYPTFNTIVLSFRDNTGEGFIGFENYVTIFTDGDFQRALINSVAWVIVVPLFSVLIGLGFAVLADRLGSKSEAFSKTFIFTQFTHVLDVGLKVIFFTLD